MDLTWSEPTLKKYESGLDRGVLYLRDGAGDYPLGVPWNGLTGISETPAGAEITDLYANNVKYASLQSAETFGGSIEAYTYPDEFNACDGSIEQETGVYVKQQTRAVFGLSYRTRIGSDAGGDEVGYKYHMVYGCRATPSEVSLTTINESPEAQSFSWDFTTTPTFVAATLKDTSTLVIDGTKVSAAFLLWLENQLYGDSPTNTSNLPLPDEILAQAAIL